MIFSVFFLIWIIPYDNTFSSLMCIGLGSLLFGGVYSTISSITKLLRKRPVLIIDENGFTELIEFEPVGRIPWGYVHSCHLAQGRGSTVLMVYLKDYEFIINKFQGVELMNITRAISIHETCVFIPCKDLMLKPENLFEEFDNRIFNPGRKRTIPENDDETKGSTE